MQSVSKLVSRIDPEGEVRADFELSILEIVLNASDGPERVNSYYYYLHYSPATPKPSDMPQYHPPVTPKPSDMPQYHLNVISKPSDVPQCHLPVTPKPSNMP